MPYASPAAPTSQPLQKETNRVSARIETVRVLLVEDEPVTCQVFSRALQKSGHHVRVASDGNKALHALRDDAPDLVVLDLGLPTVPGLEVLRRIRESARPDLPVLVVSGAPARAYKAGRELVTPGAWLEKPVRPHELVEAVEALAARS